MCGEEDVTGCGRDWGKPAIKMGRAERAIVIHPGDISGACSLLIFEPVLPCCSFSLRTHATPYFFLG